MTAPTPDARAAAIAALDAFDAEQVRFAGLIAATPAVLLSTPLLAEHTDITRRAIARLTDRSGIMACEDWRCLGGCEICRNEPKLGVDGKPVLPRRVLWAAVAWACVVLTLAGLTAAAVKLIIRGG